MKLNVYIGMPNKNIQSDQFPIINSMTRLINYLEPRLTDKDAEIKMCVSYDFINDKATRAIFLLSIHDSLKEELREYFKENPKQFSVEFKISVPFKGTLKIENLDKLLSHINVLEDSIKDHLKKVDQEGKLNQLREELTGKLSEEGTLEQKFLWTSELAYIYSYIDNQIETHREELQSKMMADIKYIREEAEKVITNELDIVNDSLKTVLKDEAEEENKILKCVYNGETISSREMIKRLKSHMLPEYLTQIDINDTLDDEYRIDMEKTIIIRSKGGGIKVSKRMN